MARPLSLDIQWNRRSSHLDQIVNELHKERPVVLKISGIPDEHRIQASQELKRTPFWNDLHTTEHHERGAPRSVDPRRDGEKAFLYTDGAASDPVLTGLRLPYAGGKSDLLLGPDAVCKRPRSRGEAEHHRWHSSPNAVLSCCEMKSREPRTAKRAR